MFRVINLAGAGAIGMGVVAGRLPRRDLVGFFGDKIEVCDAAISF